MKTTTSEENALQAACDEFYSSQERVILVPVRARIYHNFEMVINFTPPTLEEVEAAAFPRKKG